MLDVPAQTPARLKGVQDVAVGGRGAARLRAEQLEFGDPVPIADRGKAALIDLHSRDEPHQATVATDVTRQRPVTRSSAGSSRYGRVRSIFIGKGATASTTPVNTSPSR